MEELEARIRQQNLEKEAENRAREIQYANVAAQAAVVANDEAVLASQLQHVESQPLPTEMELLRQEQELDRQIEEERRAARKGAANRAPPPRVGSAKGGKENNRAAIPMIPPAALESNRQQPPATGSRERRQRPVHYTHLMGKAEANQMDQFLNPVKGIRDEMRRAGVEPKNHLQEQREHIHGLAARRQQATMAEKDAADERLRRESNLRLKAREKAQNTLADQGPARRRVPEESERGSSAARHEAGVVPAYLQRRKAEWAAQAQEEEERQAARADCPPGLRVVGEEEKARIMQTLQTERGKAEESLRSLPFVVKTQATQQKKDALEARVVEIDGAIAAYSKERVLVPAE